MRKAFIFFSILALFVGGVVLFRYPLLMVGTRSLLNRKFPDAIVYKNMATREGRVRIQQLHIHQDAVDLTLDGVEFGLEFKEIFKNPRLFFDLYRKGVSNWIQIFAPMKEYGVGLSIKQGILQLDEHRYYFQLKNGEKRHEIATLCISHDPGLLQHPFLVIQFHMRADQIIAQISVEQVQSDRFLKLAAFLMPEWLNGFENASGQLQMHANAIFEKNGKIEEFSTRVVCEDFEIHYPKLQLAVQMQHFSGSLNYPEGINHPGFPIWKKLQCGFLLEEGNLVFGENLSLSNLQGTLALDPRQDPALDLSGELVGHETPLVLHLGGKGSVHDDRAYWLEFMLNLDDRKGTECGAFLSICRPDTEALVLQLEAQNLLPSQVEMLKCYLARSKPNLHQWEIREGSFGGKLIAVFEKGELAHLEVQDLIGDNVILASGHNAHYFTKIHGEGRLFGDMNFNIDLPADQFFALISPELKNVYSAYRPDDGAHLSITTQLGKKEIETSAHVDFLETEQAFQFGFKSHTVFPSSLAEISEGWARSEKLSHLLYGPFVRLMDSDLEIYGNIDLVAVYGNNKLDLALQVDEFLSKHPLFDLKAAQIGEKGKTQGRAKFVYDFSTQQLSGTIPLRGAKAYDRQYGLCFRDLDTDLTLMPDHFHASVKRTNISFDGLKLLRDAQFDLSYQNGIAISALLARLPLASDREFLIKAPYFNRTSCELAIMDGKQELAHFTGTNQDLWKGNLKLSSMKDPLAVSFNWDPFTNSAILDAEREGLRLRCKKEGAEISVETLEIGNLHFKGALAKHAKEEGFILPYFEVQRPDLNVQGSGTFFLDLPQKHSAFGVRGDLVLEANLQSPVAVKVKAAQPFKIAYSPSLGLIFSGLGIEGEGCHVDVGYFEYQNINGNTHANNCHFNLSEEFIATFIDAGTLPALLQDFQVFQGFQGQANCSIEKGVTHWNGKLQGKEKDFDFAVEWKNKAGKFSLNDCLTDEALTFAARFDQEGLRFDSIKGGVCGLTLDLKKRKENELKGSVILDCALFGKLFNLPLNRYFSLWKTGGKYHFDGLFTPQPRLYDWFFKGKAKGQGFECAGYRFRSFEAKVEVEPGRVNIESLDLTDEAGKMWIGDGALVRANDGQWIFSFPSVEIRGFQPSFLNRIGSAEKKSNPLAIKTATLRDVRGRIDDLSSVTAEGSLRFSNFSKKGEKQPLKNLPTNVLKQMGLDEGVLVPVSGDMRYSIQNGRFYLKGLDSVISERKRSEFQSPRNGTIGYFDFNGNLFLDFQVKQNVTRSNSSLFPLKVRGTWDDPQFVIK